MNKNLFASVLKSEVNNEEKNRIILDKDKSDLTKLGRKKTLGLNPNLALMITIYINNIIKL